MARSVASSDQDQTGLVKNLREFKHQKKMKQTAMLPMAVGLSSSQLRELNQSFAAIDENRDGLISIEEFMKFMHTSGIENEDEGKRAFLAIDQDNTGVIKYTEFLAAAMDEKALENKEDIEAAFHRLDLDGSGSLDASEIK